MTGEQIFQRELKTARTAYPQYADKPDAFVLAMLASNRARHSQERLDALSRMGAQAQRIANLEARVS